MLFDRHRTKYHAELARMGVITADPEFFQHSHLLEEGAHAQTISRWLRRMGILLHF